ncbi:hypothetical protein [Hoeflea sp. EC-HK425]|uniref:hypothetical protein n=1 Tax=Hoeflea sp. EC-HK425 TaxID=2038388 RepID=UPI0012578471|nr:hypothetical protein [Hoeflea sp. EC-HK425]VVT12243.1 hypothetical protein HOE425_330701 [Hoeflea sp. EC-HK425]
MNITPSETLTLANTPLQLLLTEQSRNGYFMISQSIWHQIQHHLKKIDGGVYYVRSPLLFHKMIRENWVPAKVVTDEEVLALRELNLDSARLGAEIQLPFQRELH